jgi:peptidoglycan/xylan/chitin deacetylase (PgdA/CDA1 family)
VTAARGASGPIPVLLYHRIGPDPSAWIAPFTVTTSAFERHLELVAASGRTPITVSHLRDGLAGRVRLPARPVVITFDDGFADTRTIAAPLLARRSVPATIYLTTGFLSGRSPGGDRMLDWAQANELAHLGHEIGAHTVSHPQLDTLPAHAARTEIESCRRRLEDSLGMPIRSFAYPHGYSSPTVRRLVLEAGYDSACSVKNVLSGPDDPVFSLARLTLTSHTRDETVRSWLDGGGARVGLPDDRPAAVAWRTYRRTRAGLTRAVGRA